jgi:hypothetical protein
VDPCVVSVAPPNSHRRTGVSVLPSVTLTKSFFKLRCEKPSCRHSLRARLRRAAVSPRPAPALPSPRPL